MNETEGYVGYVSHDDQKTKHRLDQLRNGAQPFVRNNFDTKTIVNDCPIIMISREAFSTMGMLVTLCAKEVGWFGLVEKQDNDIYLINKIIIPEQQVSYATTEISSGGIAEFMIGLMNQDPENAAAINKQLRFWGHSHADMGIEPSQQDYEQMKDFMHCEFFIMGIANRKQDLKFWLYLNKKCVVIADVPWYLYDPDTGFNDRLVQISAEIEQKVKPLYKHHSTPKIGFYQPNGPITPGVRYVVAHDVADDDGLKTIDLSGRNEQSVWDEYGNGDGR